MLKKQGNEGKTQGDTLEDDIRNITPMQIPEQVGDINKKALASEIADSESDLSRHLDKVSNWMAWQCHQDKDDALQTYRLKILASTTPIHNPKAWLNTTASNDRKNVYRHKEVENAYLDEFRQAQESTRHNGKPIMQFTAAMDPEQELLEKERQSLLNDVLRRVLEEFPAEIVSMWIMGKSPKEIIEETGSPTSTIYRTLSKMEKAIVNAKAEIEILLHRK